MDFNDRRRNARPDPEDYDRPLTRETLIEANRKFRENGVQDVIGTDPDTADKIIRRTVKERFNRRRRLTGDFDTVGEYLEWLSQQAE